MFYQYIDSILSFIILAAFVLILYAISFGKKLLNERWEEDEANQKVIFEKDAEKDETKAKALQEGMARRKNVKSDIHKL